GRRRWRPGGKFGGGDRAGPVGDRIVGVGVSVGASGSVIVLAFVRCGSVAMTFWGQVRERRLCLTCGHGGIGWRPDWPARRTWGSARCVGLSVERDRCRARAGPPGVFATSSEDRWNCRWSGADREVQHRSNLVCVTVAPSATSVDRLVWRWWERQTRDGSERDGRGRGGSSRAGAERAGVKSGRTGAGGAGRDKSGRIGADGAGQVGPQRSGQSGTSRAGAERTGRVKSGRSGAGGG
ncbi:MAG: hypothetical protein QOH84_5164, partial [Kribbellaceae bacterium]|nr:hypothetical protein [Kribbellaceae bacterium]